jgi:hypothetical protein
MPEIKIHIHSNHMQNYSLVSSNVFTFRQQSKRLYWRVATITQIQSPLNALLSQILVSCCCSRSRDSTVGITTGYRLGDWESEFKSQYGQECSFLHQVQTSAEVNKTWVYKSTPPYVFMPYCLASYAQRQLYVLLSFSNIWTVQHFQMVCLLHGIYHFREVYVTGASKN